MLRFWCLVGKKSEHALHTLFLGKNRVIATLGSNLESNFAWILQVLTCKLDHGVALFLQKTTHPSTHNTHTPWKTIISSRELFGISPAYLCQHKRIQHALEKFRTVSSKPIHKMKNKWRYFAKFQSLDRFSFFGVVLARSFFPQFSIMDSKSCAKERIM